MTQSSADAVLRIGTRGSPLALAQAHEVRAKLAQAHGFAPEAVAICVIRTSGDRIQDRPLAEAGGKGLFTKEIEEALSAGTVDLAVHSAKDVPTWRAPGLALAAFLEREDVRDAFISMRADGFDALPAGAVVGTASLRRQAQVLRLRPDLKVVSFRGNVQTRLRKLDEGEVDATLLALAGLNRLGRPEVARAVLPLDDFLPALGQGAIAIETRGEDARTRALVAPLDHADTADALAAERAFLEALDGSCRTPIAGHARIEGDAIFFHGMVLRPDGSESFAAHREGARGDAARLGADAGAEIKARMPADFFAQA